jgi:hypothetical protein
MNDSQAVSTGRQADRQADGKTNRKMYRKQNYCRLVTGKGSDFTVIF